VCGRSYNSLAECQAVCKAPVKYRCIGTPDYQCIVDPAGPYSSLAECQAACAPAPSPKIFRITTMGTPNRPIGVTIIKSAIGDHTADEACKESCNIIKMIK
jgi:hypothetical protein